MANALIQNPVDRENHIVHGVKVLGFTSANGRIYDFAAVKEAIQKYEKAPVNKDHNMEEPSFSDRLGWLENVTLEKDGLYADFHYNPHADGIESFLWFAEHNGLGDVGFSHLVSGKYSVDPDGTERITRIDKVKSVDLVANPATTKTIFEQEVKPMGKKIAKEGYKSIGSTWTPEEWKKQVEKNIADTKKTFPNVKFFTKDGHPDWHAHGINPKTMQYYSKESESETKPMGKKIAKEAGNAANKAKKNAIDDRIGQSYDKKWASVGGLNGKDSKSMGRQIRNQTDPGVHWDKLNKIARGEQEDDSVDEAYKDQPSDPYDLGVFIRKQGGKKTDNPFGDGIGKTWNSDQFDRGFSGRPRAVFKTKPSDPGEQEGDSEMDKKKLMEEENPMQQQEGEENPMEEAEDIYAKVKEVCEGEGSDDEKAKQVLEMLGLSGGMSEAEDDEEMKEDDDEETKEQDSEVLENDDEEMKEDDDEEMKEEEDDEDPRKESRSELKSLRKWKAEKLKQEKIVNLIKESNLEPTKVFIKQLSAIDSKLWGEAINDRKKVALVKSSVKPISSGLQSRSESSYKQFLESVLGK